MCIISVTVLLPHAKVIYQPLQCWCGKDRNSSHHRPCPRPAAAGEGGGYSRHHLPPPHSENEDGPECGMYIPSSECFSPVDHM